MAYVTSWERIARKDGKKEEKLNIARRLIESGVDMDIISAATGFSKKKIETLAETVH